MEKYIVMLVDPARFDVSYATSSGFTEYRSQAYRHETKESAHKVRKYLHDLLGKTFNVSVVTVEG